MKGRVRYKYPNPSPSDPLRVMGDDGIITAITMDISVQSSRMEEKGGCQGSRVSIKIPVNCYIIPVNVYVIDKGVNYLPDANGVTGIKYTADGINGGFHVIH